jgi:hypothetical protein
MGRSLFKLHTGTVSLLQVTVGRGKGEPTIYFLEQSRRVVIIKKDGWLLLPY